MRVAQEGNKLIISSGISRVFIEPWGKNSLRVRMTGEPVMDDQDRKSVV